MEAQTHTAEETDDELAELIATLTREEIARLWSAILQEKPYLAD
jgi:hypothetical protein